MPVSYITHKGRKILYVNFKDMKSKEVVLANLEDMKKHYVEASDKIYLLLDVRGTFTDPEVMDRLKHYGKQYFKGKSEKRAVLGVSGIKKIMLKGYALVTNTDVKPFEDEEEAKNYLAS
ncbi:STAS/SEC14 domain-containing protein [Ekhidna sp.]|uniref:STAS/SEC14 domain-containing protein n=1 Tax=Ekhidna sp. TaxID=2608089 RepID=UPI003CCBDC23